MFSILLTYTHIHVMPVRRANDYSNVPNAPSWRPLFLKDLQLNSAKGALWMLGAAAIFYFALSRVNQPK